LIFNTRIGLRLEPKYWEALVPDAYRAMFKKIYDSKFVLIKSFDPQGGVVTAKNNEGDSSNWLNDWSLLFLRAETRESNQMFVVARP